MKAAGRNIVFLKASLILVGIMCCSFTANEGPDINAKVKAIFLYNFSKYIEWPETMASGRFRIGIYGDYPAIREELEKMSKIKRRGDRSFEIMTFNSMDEIQPTHILYVVKNSAVDMSQISKRLGGSSTLLVTEGDGFINQGAHINLYYENNKQMMELNPATFDQHGLKVSTQLLSISKVVNG